MSVRGEHTTRIRFDEACRAALTTRGILSPLVGPFGQLAIRADVLSTVSDYLEDLVGEWPDVPRTKLSDRFDDARTFFEWISVLADALGVPASQRGSAELLFASRWHRTFDTHRAAVVEERGTEHWQRLVTSVTGTTYPPALAHRVRDRMNLNSLAGFSITTDIEEARWEAAAKLACEWLQRASEEPSQIAKAVGTPSATPAESQAPPRSDAEPEPEPEPERSCSSTEPKVTSVGRSRSSMLSISSNAQARPASSTNTTSSSGSRL
jgi:hypothetical protein